MASEGRRKGLKAEPTSSLDVLRRALSAAEDERADAVRVRHDLEDRRGDVVADGDEEGLRQHDEKIAAAKRRIDLAESKHARTLLDLQSEERATEQARRRVIHERGTAAIAEARAIMAAEYVPAAQAVVDVLKRVAELRAVARAANLDLPEDTAPIELTAEPFNGRNWLTGAAQEIEETRLVHRETGERAPAGIVSGPMYVERRVKVKRPAPTVPAVPHLAIADFVNLPGLARDQYLYAAPFWGRPRI